jgi:hypothetical protein
MSIAPVHWTHVIAEQLPLLVEVHHLRRRIAAILLRGFRARTDTT